MPSSSIIAALPSATDCRRTHALHALAGDRLEAVTSTACTALLGAGDDRFGRADVRSRVPGSRRAGEVVFINVVDRNHIGQLRLAFGQRAGLVDDQRVDLGKALQRFGVLDQHAFLRAAAGRVMIDIGVARPSAQGQAMMSTAPPQHAHRPFAVPARKAPRR